MLLPLADAAMSARKHILEDRKLIDPKNVHKSIVMSEDEFKKIAAQGERGALVNVVEIGNEGWAIFGPFGFTSRPTEPKCFPIRLTYTNVLVKWVSEDLFKVGD